MRLGLGDVSHTEMVLALRYMCSSIALVCQLTHPYKYASSNLVNHPSLVL